MTDMIDSEDPDLAVMSTSRGQAMVPADLTAADATNILAAVTRSAGFAEQRQTTVMSLRQILAEGAGPVIEAKSAVAAAALASVKAAEGQLLPTSWAKGGAVAGIAGLNLGAKFAPPENRVTTLGAALLKNFPQEWTVDGSLAESMKSRALLGWDGGALTRKLALSIGPNLGETMFTTLAESLARVDGYYNHLLNAALPRPWKDARSPIRAMLTGWEGLLHQGGEMARAMARVALMAAMRAREAVVQGDEDFVREFVIRWLRRKPQPWVMEAAAMVLLENEWLPADLDADGYEVIEKLRVLVGRYTRYYKPLEATQIRGRKIRSLDKPVGFNTLGEPITLLEVSPDPGAADPAELWSVDDPRLVHALARFKPEEQAVIEHSLATTKQHGRKPHSRSDCHPTMGKRCGGSVNEWPRKSIGKWLPSPRSPSPDRDVWSALAPFRRGCG